MWTTVLNAFVTAALNWLYKAIKKELEDYQDVSAKEKKIEALTKQLLKAQTEIDRIKATIDLAAGV